MTTRFTGSRSLDDRRRRRLAGGAEADAAQAESSASLAGTSAIGDSSAAPGRQGGSSAGLSEDGTSSHFPIGRLISPKLWKHIAVAFLGLLVAAGILFTGSSVSGGETRLGPGFVRLFDLSTGHVARHYCGLLLLLSSQLALFIWWARSRSPRDFGGRYRLWAWCVLFGFAAAVITATGIHVAWSETILWLWDIDFWHKTTLVWMIPVAMVATWVLRTLHREMRDCRASLALLWMAAGCGLSAALLMLGAVRFPLTAEEHLLLSRGVEMTAHWALFVSLLLHARHVVHVTADPAQLRPFPIRLRGVVEWLKSMRPARSVRDTTADADVASEPEVKQPAASRFAKDSISDVDLMDDSVWEQPTSDVSEPALDESTDEVEAPQDDEADPDLEPIVHNDPIDKETLKGMSKRERRRLRKERREAQRSDRTHRRAG